jgi:hypothetical protein
VGEIRGSGIVVDQAASYISSGPRFGPEFDPDRVDLRPWGKYVLSFSDCDTGVMHYRSNDPDYGNGSLDLTRLTTIGAPGCGGESGQGGTRAIDGSFEIGSSMSGAWYDPDHDGEGWLLEVLGEGRALVAWFSYDDEGRQAWFFNTGEVSGDRVVFELLKPSGTDFGPTFDPGQLDLPAWGSAEFVFDGCDSGTMTYDSVLPGFGSGSLKLTRLTTLAGLECR